MFCIELYFLYPNTMLRTISTYKDINIYYIYTYFNLFINV